MAELTTLEIVNNKVTELEPLYNRMDKTRDYAYLIPYKLKDFNEVELENVISVTTNWPAVYANAIINDLMGSIWQTVIESNGKMSDKQKHDVENFIDDNLAQADEQLIRRGFVELFAWLCNHVCIRSYIGVRWISQFDKGEYKIDCLPVDMRWCPFEYDIEGLKWVANRTFRSAAQIKAKYPKVDVGTDETEVIDHWDRDKNEIWIADELVSTQKNPFGFVPFVIAKPPSGFMLRDKGYIAHEAEDIFALNRGIYDELSRLLSLEQTLAQDVLFPPMEQESKDVAKKADKRPKSGQTTKVKEGELHKLLPRGDLTKAFMSGRVDMQKMAQMGGVNDIDLGNVSQEVSAVWITEQSEIRNKLIKPRLKALVALRQGLGRMQIDQYKIISEKAKKGKSAIFLGVTGRKREYTPQQLGDPGTYTITNELRSQNKKMEIVNLAMFEASRGDLPLEMRLKDILKVDDPDGIMRQLGIEEARQADPAIGLFDMAMRYAEEAEEHEGDDAEALKVKSQMLTERCVAIIRLRVQQPQELPEEATVPEVKKEGASKPIISLLGGGTSGARGPAPAPAEEE